MTTQYELEQLKMEIEQRDIKISRLEKDIKVHLLSKRYRLGSILIDGIKRKKIKSFINIPKDIINIYNEKSSENNIVNYRLVDSQSNKLIVNKVYTVDEEYKIFNDYYKYSILNNKIKFPFESNDQIIVNNMERLKRKLVENYNYLIQDKKISIIMPTFNRADIIKKAIESVLKQSYTNWELIIVDDFSIDDTKNVINSLLYDSRIVYVTNEETKGVSGARNTGLKKATGEYICYLDTDNDWDENYLLLIANTFKANKKYEAIYTAQNIYKVHNSKLILDYVRFGVFNESLLENRNYIDLNCYSHKKSLYNKYGGFDESLSRLVDWELILRYSTDKNPYCLPCILSNYYFDFADNQITSKSSKEYNEHLNKFTRKINYNILKLDELKYLHLDGYSLYSLNKKIKYNLDNKKIGIIIPNYEALECLKVCISSIVKYTPSSIEYEIIIVDNDSSKDVREYLKYISKQYHFIKIIQNEHNMGFTYAVNQGIKEINQSSDIILLNNDAIVTKGWIEALYKVKDSIPKAGIIVPRQVLIPNTKTMTTHVPSCNTNREVDVNISVHHQNIIDVSTYMLDGYIKLNFAPFFMVMITRECFNKLGYLDEVNGRHYKSDRLYCELAIKNDVEIIYTPKSKVYHLLQQSTLQLENNDKKLYDCIFLKNNWDDLGECKYE